MIDPCKLSLMPRPWQCQACGDLVYLAFSEIGGLVHLVDRNSHSLGELTLRIAILDEGLQLCQGIRLAAGAPIFVAQRYDERLHANKRRYKSHFDRCKASLKLYERTLGCLMKKRKGP